jgi:hypothetical protein
MTNHPNRGKTYWKLHPRRFQNEYTVGVATTKEDAEQYQAEGFSRIEREVALHYLSRRPDNGEQLYVAAQLNGRDIEEMMPRFDSRYDFARQIRRGEI